MPSPPSSDDRPAPARPPAEPLTRREREVLARIATGSPNAAIAEAMGVQLATVKSHISSLYRKLGVANRVEATRYYLARREELRGPSAPQPPSPSQSQSQSPAAGRPESGPATPRAGRPGAPTAHQVDAQLRELRDEAERLRRRLDALRDPLTHTDGG